MCSKIIFFLIKVIIVMTITMIMIIINISTG